MYRITAIGCTVILILNGIQIVHSDVSHLTTKVTANQRGDIPIIIDDDVYEASETIQNPTISHQNAGDDHTHWDIRNNIPGEPDVDYPIYSIPPETSFTCQNRHDGYYADVEARCQVFRVCANTDLTGKGFAFLCPNGTLFNQKWFVCDWYKNVDCSQSESYYGKNSEIGNMMGTLSDMMETVQRMLDYTQKPLNNGNGIPISPFISVTNNNSPFSPTINNNQQNTGQKPLQTFSSFPQFPVNSNPVINNNNNNQNGNNFKPPLNNNNNNVFVSNLGELSTDPGTRNFVNNPNTANVANQNSPFSPNNQRSNLPKNPQSQFGINNGGNSLPQNNNNNNNNNRKPTINTQQQFNSANQQQNGIVKGPSGLPILVNSLGETIEAPLSFLDSLSDPNNPNNYRNIPISQTPPNSRQQLQQNLNQLNQFPNSIGGNSRHTISATAVAAAVSGQTNLVSQINVGQSSQFNQQNLNDQNKQSQNNQPSKGVNRNSFTNQGNNNNGQINNQFPTISSQKTGQSFFGQTIQSGNFAAQNNIAQNGQKSQFSGQQITGQTVFSGQGNLLGQSVNQRGGNSGSTTNNAAINQQNILTGFSSQGTSFGQRINQQTTVTSGIPQNQPTGGQTVSSGSGNLLGQSFGSQQQINNGQQQRISTQSGGSKQNVGTQITTNQHQSGQFVYSGQGNLLGQSIGQNGKQQNTVQTSSTVGQSTVPSINLPAGPTGQFVYSGEGNLLGQSIGQNGKQQIAGPTKSSTGQLAGPTAQFVYSGQGNILGQSIGQNGNQQNTGQVGSSTGQSAGPTGQFIYSGEGNLLGQSIGQNGKQQNGNQQNTGQVGSSTGQVVGPTGQLVYSGEGNLLGQSIGQNDKQQNIGQITASVAGQSVVGQTGQFVYSGEGNLLGQSIGQNGKQQNSQLNGPTGQFVYSGEGNLLGQSIGQRGNQQKNAGQVSSSSGQSAGPTGQLVYSGEGNLLGQSIGQQGNQQQSAGQVTSSSGQPAGPTGQFVYSGEGNLLGQSIGQNGKQQNTGQITSSAGQPAGPTGQFVYSGEGNLLGQSIGQNNKQQTTSQINQSAGGKTGQFVYSGEGNLLGQSIGQRGQQLSPGQISSSTSQPTGPPTGQFVSSGEGNLLGQSIGQRTGQQTITPSQPSGQLVYSGQGNLLSQSVNTQNQPKLSQTITTTKQTNQAAVSSGQFVNSGQGNLLSQSIGAKQALTGGQAATGQFVYSGEGNLLSQSIGGNRPGQQQSPSGQQNPVYSGPGNQPISSVGQTAVTTIQQQQQQHQQQYSQTSAISNQGNTVIQSNVPQYNPQTGQYVYSGEGNLLSQSIGQRGTQQNQVISTTTATQTNIGKPIQQKINTVANQAVTPAAQPPTYNTSPININQPQFSSQNDFNQQIYALQEKTSAESPSVNNKYLPSQQYLPVSSAFKQHSALQKQLPPTQQAELINQQQHTYPQQQNETSSRFLDKGELNLDIHSDPKILNHSNRDVSKQTKFTWTKNDDQKYKQANNNNNKYLKTTTSEKLISKKDRTKEKINQVYHSISIDDLVDLNYIQNEQNKKTTTQTNRTSISDDINETQSDISLGPIIVESDEESIINSNLNDDNIPTSVNLLFQGLQLSLFDKNESQNSIISFNEPITTTTEASITTTTIKTTTTTTLPPPPQEQPIQIKQTPKELIHKGNNTKNTPFSINSRSSHKPRTNLNNNNNINNTKSEINHQTTNIQKQIHSTTIPTTTTRTTMVTNDNTTRLNKQTKQINISDNKSITKSITQQIPQNNKTRETITEADLAKISQGLFKEIVRHTKDVHGRNKTRNPPRLPSPSSNSIKLIFERAKNRTTDYKIKLKRRDQIALDNLQERSSGSSSLAVGSLSNDQNQNITGFINNDDSSNLGDARLRTLKAKILFKDLQTTKDFQQFFNIPPTDRHDTDNDRSSINDNDTDDHDNDTDNSNYNDDDNDDDDDDGDDNDKHTIKAAQTQRVSNRVVFPSPVNHFIDQSDLKRPQLLNNKNQDVLKILPSTSSLLSSSKTIITIQPSHELKNVKTPSYWNNPKKNLYSQNNRFGGVVSSSSVIPTSANQRVGTTNSGYNHQQYYYHQQQQQNQNQQQKPLDQDHSSSIKVQSFATKNSLTADRAYDQIASQEIVHFTTIENSPPQNKPIQIPPLQNNYPIQIQNNNHRNDQQYKSKLVFPSQSNVPASLPSVVTSSNSNNNNYRQHATSVTSTSVHNSHQQQHHYQHHQHNGKDSVEVKIVPSTGWYLNDANERKSYLNAVDHGLLNENGYVFVNKVHSTNGVSSGGAVVGVRPSSIPAAAIIEPRTLPKKNEISRSDTITNLNDNDDEDDSYFKGRTSYETPLSSVGQLSGDSNSVNIDGSADGKLLFDAQPRRKSKGYFYHHPRRSFSY